MAVDDLWYLTKKDENKKRIPSARHGRGKRWRVRYTDPSGQARTRLFTARVDRLRATYSFTARMFVRFTGQYEVTRRSPELYLAPITAKAADFAGSLLFAYKINWQSVVFLGYGDNRTLSETTQNLEPDARQVFVKLSHAFQW